MTPTIARPANTAARHTVKTKTWQGYSEVYWHASSNNNHHVKHPEGNSKHADLTPLSQYDSTQCNSFMSLIPLYSVWLHFNSTLLNSTQLNSTQLNSAQLSSTQLQLYATQVEATPFISFDSMCLNSVQFNSTHLNSTHSDSSQLNVRRSIHSVMQPKFNLTQPNSI